MQGLIFAMAVAAILTMEGSVVAGEVPRSVAGFTLGQPIEAVAERVIMETALPVRYMESLQEVEIKPAEGFKSGLIAFSTCRKPNTILRIKLKYADGSAEFYEQLLRRFKKKFGEPNEYQGDPFHVFKSWKWSFKDGEQNRISLVLQHNLQDEEEKIGNAVKLIHHSYLEEDARCFAPQKSRRIEEMRQRPIAVPAGEPAWDRFVPN